MRDPNRFYGFYNELVKIHVCVPDLRFGQLMVIFFDWCNEHKLDPFVLEDDELLNQFKTFIRQCKYKNGEEE